MRPRVGWQRVTRVSISACDEDMLSRDDAFWVCLGTGAMGAALMYLMDPERGRRRRNMLRDRWLARARRLARAMTGIWRGAAAETYGVSHRIAHLVPREPEIVDDETLRQRVESQLYRDRQIPKGNLNISCEHGAVILRGVLESAEEIERIEARVRRVAGVRGVQNLLHPYGTTAPNKERSLLAC